MLDRQVIARATRWTSAAVMTLAVGLGLGGCGHRPVDYGGVAVMEGSLRRAKRADEALRRSMAAVAIIETDVTRGMGFVIDPSGYLITNRHVIEDAEHVRSVVLPGRDPSRAYGSVQVVYIDPLRDLALLHVHTDAPLPAVALATDTMAPIDSYLQASDPVVVLERTAIEGATREAPEDETSALRLHHGRVTALDVVNPDVGPGRFVGVTTDVHRGQSGGPVLDRHGRVVGIVTWTLRDAGGGYAIPIADATRMLAERPTLEVEAQQHRRAERRAREFLDAVQRGDGDAARRITSPTQARKRREGTVDEILSHAQAGEGLALMRTFVAALEVVVTEVVEADDPAVARDGLQALVMHTARPDVIDALHLPHEIGLDQVVSFFHELGHAYLHARIFGGEDGEQAVLTALQRLRTVDASRSFVVAALVTELGGRAVTVDAVEVVPGAYAPRARATLSVTQPDGRALAYDLHLRLEWGDWYVAGLDRVAT